jgi:hypothetical protein
VKRIVLMLLFLAPLSFYCHEIMVLDSVKIGMKGYGISVFEANSVDSFGVEILGIMDNIGPGRKLIIARLSGAGLEKTGIIAGMSGSPVFIGGKIVGAVAYGWTFALEPLTGITPIEEILQTKVEGMEGMGDGAEIRIEGEGALSPYAGATLNRIQTPLVVSGFDEFFIEEFDGYFGQKGFSIVLGGASSGGATGDDSLFAGAPVSAQLIDGDASIGAVGTVTYIDGNDVFAFGHPLFHSGSVSFPMATAEVITIMPSQYSSFKITNTKKEIGVIVQDRDDAVYGIIGQQAKTVPLTVTVERGSLTKTYSFRIVDHRELTPYFASAVFGNSVIAQGRAYGSLTLDVSFTLQLDSYDDLTLRNFFSGDLALTHSMNTMGDILSMLLNDRFGPIAVEGVGIHVRVIEETRSALIENAKPSSFTVKRGKDVKVTVFMRDAEGNPIDKTCILHIPRTYADSIARIAVVGADGIMSLERERVSSPFVAERPGHVLELLKAMPRNNVLYCLLLSSKQGMIVHGFELGSLPSSMLHLMEESQNLGEGRFTQGGIVSSVELECDFLVSGSNVITLKVVD